MNLNSKSDFTPKSTQDFVNRSLPNNIIDNEEKLFNYDDSNLYSIKIYSSYPYLITYFNSLSNSMIFNLNDKNNILKESVKNYSILQTLNFQDFASGITGGLISTSVLHPLDLLKIRLAVNDGQTSTRPTYHGLKNAYKKIKAEEGIRGFYRGVVPNCLGAGIAWGFYFLFYNAFKINMMKGKDVELSFEQHMLAAAEAGIVSLAITNPLWVVKTRLCLQYGNSKASQLPSNKQYKGMIDTFIKVYKYEGLRGFYKGFVPGILGVSHGSIQFMIYEELKKNNKKKYNKKSNIDYSILELLKFSIISKMCASTITYPFQVIRARLQDQHSTYQGLIDAVKKTYIPQGVRGFYKGFFAYFLHVSPNVCIVFLIHEYFKKLK